jgi:hypothetical protein
VLAADFGMPPEEVENLKLYKNQQGETLFKLFSDLYK